MDNPALINVTREAKSSDVHGVLGNCRDMAELLFMATSSGLMPRNVGDAFSRGLAQIIEDLRLAMDALEAAE